MLSLHQRDVLRAGEHAVTPAEWARHAPPRVGGKLAPPRPESEQAALSSDRTLRLLQRSANGAADTWVVEVAARDRAAWGALGRAGEQPEHLRRALAGGELPQVRSPPAPRPAPRPRLARALPEQLGSVPQCAWCGISAPGLVALPCACAGAVCAECLRDDLRGGGFGSGCDECGGARAAHASWAKREAACRVARRPFVRAAAAEVDP